MTDDNGGPARTPSGGVALAGAVSLLALTALLFSSVSDTNFRGFDEWIFFSLLSRGILDFPYANRPLNLVWAWPAWLLAPGHLWTFRLFHALWIGLTGVALYAIVRRLRPGAAAFAFLAGAIAIVWAPSDSSRICTVQMILYAGCTFGALLALWLLLEAYHRRKVAWAVAAAAAAAVTVLSLEGALVLLAFGPPLLLLAGGHRDRGRFGLWSAAIVAFLGLAAARAFVPLGLAPERWAYQRDILAPNPDPVRLARRCVSQLRRHLVPLGDLGVLAREPRAAAFGAVAFGAGYLLLELTARRARRRVANGSLGPREAAVAAALGLLLALAAYAPFVLSARARVPVRTQFLSMPGIGLLLAAAIAGLCAFLPARTRLAVLGLLGSLVCALGFAQTASLQADWDGVSSFPAQRRELREIAALLPDPEPGTLVILLSTSGVWPLDFSFHHAVRWLYDGRVTGHAEGSPPYLYSIRYEPDGVRSDPLPVLVGPWQEDGRLFPYSSVVVMTEDEEGPLRLLDAWPGTLPPLPEGALYAPRARLGHGPMRLPPLLDVR